MSEDSFALLGEREKEGGGENGSSSYENPRGGGATDLVVICEELGEKMLSGEISSAGEGGKKKKRKSLISSVTQAAYLLRGKREHRMRTGGEKKEGEKFQGRRSGKSNASELGDGKGYEKVSGEEEGPF